MSGKSHNDLREFSSGDEGLEATNENKTQNSEDKQGAVSCKSLPATL